MPEPQSPATPDTQAPPQQQPSGTQALQAFPEQAPQDLEELRAYYRQRAKRTGNGPLKQAWNHRAADASMEVMAGGLIRFGSTRHWRLAPSGAGMPFDSTADSLSFASKTEAEAFATHLADVTGADGAPLPWAATDFGPAFDGWRSDRGEPIGLALARLRVDFDRSRGREPFHIAARTYQPYEDQSASRGEAPHGHIWPEEIPDNSWVHVPAHAGQPSRDVLVTSLTLLPRGEVELTLDDGQTVAVPRNKALPVAEQTEAVDTTGRTIGRRVESTLLQPGQWIQIDAKAGGQHTRERELPDMERGQVYQLRGRIRELTTTAEGQLQAHMEGVTALAGDTWANHTPDRQRSYGELDAAVWPLGQRTVQITADHAAFDAMLDRPLTVDEIEHANKSRQPSTADIILMARVVHRATSLMAATDTTYPQHDRLQPLATALPSLLAEIDRAIETTDFALLLQTMCGMHDLVDETVGSIDAYMPPGLVPLFAASSHLRSLLLHQHSNQVVHAITEVRQEWTQPSPLREMSDEELFDTVEEWEARAPRDQWAREEENWPKSNQTITNTANIVVIHDDRPGTRSRVQGLAKYDRAAASVLRAAFFRPITGSSGVNWDTDARIEPDARRTHAEQALTRLRALGRKAELRSVQQNSETSPQRISAAGPREATSPELLSATQPRPAPETQQTPSSVESNSVDEDAFNAVTIEVVHQGHPLESLVRGVAPGDARAEEVLRAAGFRRIRGSGGRGWEPRARKWETRRTSLLSAVRGLTALGRNVSSDIEDGRPRVENYRAQEHRVKKGSFSTREEHRASEDQLLKKLHGWIMYMEGHSPSTRSVHYLQEQVAVEAAKATIVQALQKQQHTHQSNGQPDRHLTDEDIYEGLLQHITTLDHDNYRRPQEVTDRRQELTTEIRRHLDQCQQTRGTTAYAAFLASDAPPPRVPAAELLPDRKLKHGNHIWTGPQAVLRFSREAHFHGRPVRQLTPGQWRVSVDHDDIRYFQTPTESEEQALARTIRHSISTLTDFPTLDSQSFQQSVNELRQSIDTWRQTASASTDRGFSLRYAREEFDRNLDHAFWLLDQRRSLRLLNETLQEATDYALRVEAALEHSYEEPADQETLRAVAHHCHILRERLETTSRTPNKLPAERRFTTIDEVRAHWKNTPDTANSRLQTDSARRAAEDLDDTDHLTLRGHLVTTRHESRGPFVIKHTGSSLTVVTTGTRHADRALTLAQALEDIAVGQQPFDWTSPGIDQRLAAHQDLVETVTALQEKTWYPASRAPGQRRTLREVVEAWPRSWISPNDSFELTAGGLVIGVHRGYNSPWHVLPASAALDLAMPPMSDRDQAHALAQHLQRELVDHTGTPLDWDSPALAEQLTTFRTSSGMSFHDALVEAHSTFTTSPTPADTQPPTPTPARSAAAPQAPAVAPELEPREAKPTPQADEAREQFLLGEAVTRSGQVVSNRKKTSTQGDYHWITIRTHDNTILAVRLDATLYVPTDLQPGQEVTITGTVAEPAQRGNGRTQTLLRSPLITPADTPARPAESQDWPDLTPTQRDVLRALPYPQRSMAWTPASFEPFFEVLIGDQWKTITTVNAFTLHTGPDLHGFHEILAVRGKEHQDHQAALATVADAIEKLSEPTDDELRTPLPQPPTIGPPEALTDIELQQAITQLTTWLDSAYPHALTEIEPEETVTQRLITAQELRTRLDAERATRSGLSQDLHNVGTMTLERARHHLHLGARDVYGRIAILDHNNAKVAHIVHDTAGMPEAAGAPLDDPRRTRKRGYRIHHSDGSTEKRAYRSPQGAMAAYFRDHHPAAKSPQSKPPVPRFASSVDFRNHLRTLPDATTRDEQRIVDYCRRAAGKEETQDEKGKPIDLAPVRLSPGKMIALHRGNTTTQTHADLEASPNHNRAKLWDTSGGAPRILSHWALQSPHRLQTIAGVFPVRTLREAETLATALEALRDHEGKPLGFDQPGLTERLRGFRDAEGRKWPTAVAVIRTLTPGLDPDGTHARWLLKNAPENAPASLTAGSHTPENPAATPETPTAPENAAPAEEPMAPRFPTPQADAQHTAAEERSARLSTVLALADGKLSDPPGFQIARATATERDEQPAPEPVNENALFAVEAVSTPTGPPNIAEDLADEPAKAARGEADSPSSPSTEQAGTAEPSVASNDATARPSQRPRQNTPTRQESDSQAHFGLTISQGAHGTTTSAPAVPADVISDPGALDTWHADGGRSASEPVDDPAGTGPLEDGGTTPVEITGTQAATSTRDRAQNAKHAKNLSPEQAAPPTQNGPPSPTPTPAPGTAPAPPSADEGETPPSFHINQWPQAGQMRGERLQAWRNRGADLPSGINLHTDPRSEATRHITDPKIRIDARALFQQHNPFAEFDAALTSALSRTRNSSVRALASQAGQVLRAELAVCADQAQEEFQRAMTAPGILHHARGYERDVPAEQAYQRSQSAFIHVVEQAEAEAQRRGIDAGAVTAVLANAAGWDGSIRDGRLMNTQRLNGPVHAAYRSAHDRLTWMLQRVGWLDKHNKARAALDLPALQAPPHTPASTTETGFWTSLDTARRRYTQTPLRDLSALVAAYLPDGADQVIGQAAWEEAYPLAQFEENARSVLDQITDTQEHHLVSDVQRALHADLTTLLQDTAQVPPTISQLAKTVAGHRSRAADEAEMLGLDPGKVCSHLDYITGWDGSIAITLEGSAVANYTTAFAVRTARTATGTQGQRRRRRELVAQLPDPSALLKVLTALQQPTDAAVANQQDAAASTADPAPPMTSPEPSQPTTEPMEKPMAAPSPAAQPERVAQPRTTAATPQPVAGQVVVLTVNGNAYAFQNLASDRLATDVRNALHHGGAPAARTMYGHIGKRQLPLFWEATPEGIVFSLQEDPEPVLTVAPTDMTPFNPSVRPPRDESPYRRLVTAIFARLEASGQTPPPGPRLVPQAPVQATRAAAQQLSDDASQAVDRAALLQMTAQADEQGLNGIPVNTHGPLGVVQLSVWLQTQSDRVDEAATEHTDAGAPAPETTSTPAPASQGFPGGETEREYAAPVTPRAHAQEASSTAKSARSPRTSAHDLDVGEQEPIAPERIYAALEAALPLFEQALNTPDAAAARRHLAEKRGITNPTEARRWNLGYASAGRRNRNWRAVANELHSQGFSKDELVAAGLLNITQNGKEVDQFIDSVVLPIRDAQGRTVSFIGRALHPKAIEVYGKYRSKNTPFFKKGQHLYGPDGWQTTAARGGPIYLSEGTFDANANTAALEAIGHPDPERPGVSVAPCGTALTTSHIAELAALHDGPQPLVLVFDNDRGGQDALLRQAGLTAEWNGPVHAVLINGANDPDELRLKHGDAALHQALTADSVPIDEALARIVESRAAEMLREARGADSLMPLIDAAGEMGTALGAARLPEKTVINLALHLQESLEMPAEHITFSAFIARNPRESDEVAFQRASEAIHQVMEERQRAQQPTHSQEELPIMAATDTAEPAKALPAEQLAADLEPVIQAAESSETAPAANNAPQTSAVTSPTPIRTRLVTDAQEADATLAAAGKQVTLTVPLDLQPLMQEFEALTALENQTVPGRPLLREDQRYQQIILLVAAANAALTAIGTDTNSNEHTRQRRQAALTSTVARAICINSTALSEDLTREGVRTHPLPETLRALTRTASDTADQAAGILEPGTRLTHYLTVTREMGKLITALEALAPPSQRRLPLPSWPESLTWDALRSSLPSVRRSPAAQAAADLSRRWTRLDAALERFKDDRRLNGLGRTLKIRSAEMIGTLAHHLAEVSERKGRRLSTALWEGVHHWASETVDLLRGRLAEGEIWEPGHYTGMKPNPVLQTAIQQARAARNELNALDPDDHEAPKLRAGIQARALLARFNYAAQLGASDGLDADLDPSERIGFLLKDVDRPDRLGEWSRIRTAILELAETLAERNPRRQLLDAWAKRIHRTISGDTIPDPAAAARLTVKDIHEFAQRALATQEPSPLVLADDPETFERAQHALAVMERLGIVSQADASRPEGPSRRAMLITDPDELQQTLLRAESELVTYRASLPAESAKKDPTPSARTSATAEASTVADGSADASAAPTPDGLASEPPASAAPPAGEDTPVAMPSSAETLPESGAAAPSAGPEKPRRRLHPFNAAEMSRFLLDSSERVEALTTQRPQEPAAQAVSPAVTPIHPQDQAAHQAQQPVAPTAGAGRN